MVKLADVETLAFKRPESERAKLASGVLESLPGVLVEDDEGLAEGLQRGGEMEHDPSACMSQEEFLHAVRRSA